MTRRILAGLAATSLIASPVMAQSAASALSVSAQSTTSAGESSGGGGTPIIAPILAGAIVVLGVLLATDTWPFDEDDEPVSP